MRLSVRWVAHLADDRIAVERAYKAEDVALLSGDGVVAFEPAAAGVRDGRAVSTRRTSTRALVEVQ